MGSASSSCRPPRAGRPLNGPELAEVLGIAPIAPLTEFKGPLPSVDKDSARFGQIGPNLEAL